MAKDHPAQSLFAHANGRTNIKFSESVRHGKMIFQPGEVIEFEDPAAAAYFDVAFNGTEFTTSAATRTVTVEDLNFDPDDPSGSETIDPGTIIGVGREGVNPGTTVHEAAAGLKSLGDGEAKLKVDDARADSVS